MLQIDLQQPDSNLLAEYLRCWPEKYVNPYKHLVLDLDFDVGPWARACKHLNDSSELDSDWLFMTQ